MNASRILLSSAALAALALAAVPVLARDTVASDPAAAPAAPAQDFHAKWTEDLAVAAAQAKELDRPVLILFTGSDWCPPCKALEAEVFGDAAFYDWAGQNVVLMKADFPRRKPQDPATKEQNVALRGKAPEFEGYPSLYLWNPETDAFSKVSVGYDGSGTRGVIRTVARAVQAF